MNELEIAISNIKLNGELPIEKRDKVFGKKTTNKEENAIANASEKEIINTIIKLERYDLLPIYSDVFDEIKNKEDKIRIIEKMRKVPGNWISDINLLNYFLKQKDYYIVVQFELNDFLKEEIKNEAINIVRSLNSELPKIFRENQYMLELCIQEQKEELINQFIPYIFSDNIITKYKQELVSMKNLNIEDKVYIQLNQEFFDLCLEKQRYDLLGYFNKKLLTDDIIEKYGIEIAKQHKGKIDYNLKNNKKFFDKVIEAKRYDLITYFDEQFITDDIISTYTKPILDKLYFKKFSIETFNQTNMNKVYTNSKDLLKLALKEKRNDIIFEFSSELYDEEIINLYGYHILDIVIKQHELWYFEKNYYMLDFCLKNKKYDIIKNFSGDLYDENVIKNHKDKIMELLEQGVLNYWIFYNSKYLFEAYLEKGLPEKAIYYFSEELITKDIVEKYYETLKKLINGGEITYIKLANNSYFLDKILEENMLEFALDNFYFDTFTKEIIEKHYSKIKEYINITRKVPYKLRDNEKLLDKLLDDEMVEYTYTLIPIFIGGLRPFNSELFTDERILKYYDVYKKYVIKNEELPSYLGDKPIFLEKMLKDSKFEILNYYSPTDLTEQIIEKYYDKFIEYIKEHGNEVPKTLTSEKFTMKILNNKSLEELSDFHGLYFDKELVDNNFDKLVDFVNNNYDTNLAKTLFGNIHFIEQYLFVCDIPMIGYIDFDKIYRDDLLEKHFLKITKWIQEYNKNKIPYIFVFSKKFKQFCYKNKIYDLFILLPFGTSNENSNDIEEIVKIYAELLDLTESELRYKINTLFNKNDEILMTLIPAIMTEKFKHLELQHLLTLGKHVDIQYIITNLNDHELKIFIRLLKLMDSSEYDNTPIIYNVIYNIENYNELINKINENNVTNEQLEHLLLVLQEKENIYAIENIEQLNTDIFEKNIERQHLNFKNKIKSEVVEIEELKEMLYRKKFGLSKEKIEFIYTRYCFDKEIISDSKLSADVKILLIDIHELYNCNDYEKLITNYLVSELAIVDYKTATFLESSIRKEFEKLYKEALYKIKPEHSLEQSKHLITNQESLNRLSNAQYNEKKPNIYIVDDDFNMLIHSLGAYSHYERPNNFLENWNMPKMTNHGICTSFIGNNQIANARAYHPILGFNLNESGSLLLSANYDIGSSHFNEHYATSITEPGRFLPPKAQIDYTRHTHNEMVIERMRYEADNCRKKMPSYIVYIIDDINNQYNFMTKKELIEEFKKENKNQSIIEKLKTEKDTYFIEGILSSNEISIEDAYKINCVFYYEETLQAATDMDLPIVLVDRLKYAKRENKKCEELYNKFTATNDSKYMNEILETYFNNEIGCIKYTGYNLEYYNYFNKQKFNLLYKNILEYIKSQENINTRINLLSDIINSLEKEYQKRIEKDAAVKNEKLYSLNDEIDELNQLLEEEQNKLTRGENNVRKNK